ncbi:hypothetical protein CXP39_01405 [Mesoplasma syrphidae]|uniref:Uncharacterized protein n=1 Tax=Mesoplasma syrphidae TaxID=225999 RepID=A0A2K9BJK7_9MOLU|nr:hypothetical protein [Mesoplasma syrphidae]AUF83456.1 hypothetical protein CXP39_01405 [Mesoplasma syrphidae]
MKVLLGLLSALTVGEQATTMLMSTNLSHSTKTNEQDIIKDYEIVDRAVVYLGAKVEQSFFDKKSGATFWRGLFRKEKRNRLAYTKMKADYSGFETYKAIDSTTNENGWDGPGNRAKKAMGIDLKDQTIFYAANDEVFYFSEKGITKFEWNIQKSNENQSDGLVEGIAGGVNGLLAGFGGLLTPAKPTPIDSTGEEIILLKPEQETVKNAVFSEVNNAIYYTTVSSIENIWRINRLDYETLKSTVIDSGPMIGENNYPALATSNDSDTGFVYSVLSGNISLINGENIQVIHQYSDSNQAIKVIAEKDGMWIVNASKKNGVVNLENTISYFVDIVSKETKKVAETGTWIEDVVWINDLTKYTIFNNQVRIKSTNNASSEYLYKQTPLPSTNEFSVKTVEGYSGIFDYAVSFQTDEMFRRKGGILGGGKWDGMYVNRTISDKFQEALRFTNLGNQEGQLEYSLGEKDEVYVWADPEKHAIKITGNSYISKVTLLDEDSEEEIDVVLEYNDNDKFWSVPIVKPGSAKGTDILIQFYDEENPEFKKEARLKLRDRQNVQIDLSLPENSIENNLKVSNETKEPEIFAAIREKFGLNLTNNDINIFFEKATYSTPGKIKIEAKPESHLVIKSQEIKIPTLVLDIETFRFENLTSLTDEGEIRNAVTKQLKAATDMNLDVGSNYDLDYEPATQTENGYIDIKAKMNSTLFINSQRIVLSASGAIDLATLLVHENIQLSNDITNEKILEMINKAIKKEFPNSDEISLSDLIIEKSEAKIGVKGSLYIAADPDTALIKNSVTLDIPWLKFDLDKLSVQFDSNEANQENFLNQINAIQGLKKVANKDFDFTINKATIQSEGKIVLTANKNSEYLVGKKVISIQKIYDLSTANLFDDLKVFKETNVDDIVEYLANKKGWEKVSELDLEVAISRDSSSTEEGMMLIKASSNSTRIQNQKEVAILRDRQDLNEIILEKDNFIGNITPNDVENKTEEQVFEFINKLLIKKYPNIKLDEIWLKGYDENEIEIAAKPDSEVYKNSATVTYTYKRDLEVEIPEEKRSLGIKDITPTVAAVREHFADLNFNWEQIEIDMNTKEKEKIIILKAKKDANFYKGSVEIKYAIPEDLQEVIKEKKLGKISNYKESNIKAKLQELNPNLDIEAVKIENIRNENANSSYQIVNKHYIATIESANEEIYKNSVEITFNVDEGEAEDLSTVIKNKTISVPYGKTTEIDTIKKAIKTQNPYPTIDWDLIELKFNDKNQVILHSKNVNYYYGEVVITVKELGKNLAEIITKSKIIVEHGKTQDKQIIKQIIDNKNGHINWDAAEIEFKDGKVYLVSVNQEVYVGEIEIIVGELGPELSSVIKKQEIGISFANRGNQESIKQAIIEANKELGIKWAQIKFTFNSDGTVTLSTLDQDVYMGEIVLSIFEINEEKETYTVLIISVIGVVSFATFIALLLLLLKRKDKKEEQDSQK